MHIFSRMINKIFQQSGNLKDKSRSGQPRCSTARNDHVLLCLCQTDRRKTAPELKWQWSEQSGVQCTTRTVHGQLLKHGFKSCIARKNPLIMEKQRRARHLWGKAHSQWTQAQGQRFYGQIPAISNSSKCQSPKLFLNVNQEICKSSGGLWSTNGILSHQNNANALLKTHQTESRHWCMHVA